LDHIPVFGRSVGRKYLRRASRKIRCDSVEGNAAACDQNSCLASVAKVSGQTAGTHRFGQGERGVLLAEGAIGSDSEQPLAAAASAAAGREGLSRKTHVDECHTAFLGRCG